MSLRCLLLALLLLLPGLGQAAISATDDSGRTISLTKPAQRIVSLAPHITELLYAAGAGERLVAVGSYSDYPLAARELPQVGSHNSINYESLLMMQPDLVIAWQSGNGPRVIERLRALGLTVFVSEPRRLEDIPQTLERFGQLGGSTEQAAAAAQEFRDKYQQLAVRYSERSPVRVFYQVWNAPLMTINGGQLISQVIHLCGGKNVFADLPTLAPQVNLESVLAADPEAIVTSEVGGKPPPWLYDWRRWPQLAAVQQDNLFFVPSDLLQRQGPRILEGAQILCEQLEQVRQASATSMDADH